MKRLSIAQIAEVRLRADSHTALRRISCKAEQGVLVLRGQLSTFFQKQLAQEIVAGIEGVVRVANHIEVVSSDQGRFGDSRDYETDRFHTMVVRD